MQRCIIACGILLGVLIADPASAQPYKIYVLDRSGSMSGAESGLRSETNNSRCQDEWEVARDDLGTFFDDNLNGKAAIVHFSAFYGGVVSQTNAMFGTHFVGRGSAVAALTALDPVLTGDCAGFSYNYTPLADAMCQSVELYPEGLDEDGQKLLWISSDGGENFSSGACSGPGDPSPTGPFVDKTYWQAKVLNQLLADFPQPEIKIVFWEGPFPRPTGGSGADAMDAGAAARVVAANDKAFFEFLAQETGGQLIVYRDDDPYPPIPVPAVTTWGLMIVTLMLLVGAKVYFSRRRAVEV